MKKEPLKIENEATVLPETIERIKKEIRKYKNFYEFLIEKKAIEMKNNNIIVLEFPIEQIKDYTRLYVDNLINGINDSFIFEKYAKRYTIDDGQKRYTGYFNPYSFWYTIYHHK